MTLIPPDEKSINTYLPTELLRDIFLYNIESNQMQSGPLASVCRCWRSVIISIASLWSTLRVGTWTETERVATWLQRAHPKKVIIDLQGDSQRPFGAPMFAALRNALTTTGQWHELTISSFAPEDLASQLSVQVKSPMNMLKVLHVVAGCGLSPSFTHLLDLVPTEGPLCEVRLHSSFATTYFHQPDRSLVLQNITVLSVSGGDIHEPFELLPTFTQLQIFEADRLRLPFYDPNTKLPLLYTLRKLQLRACSVQWMAGRQFPRLEECAILLPRHWDVIQQHEVQLPSCEKLTYHGHPMSTARHFHVPNMKAMELKSDDCNDQRVYQQLRHLWRVDGRISNLTTLHLTFQCSEWVLMKVLKYLVPLQELVLSIAHPSHSWEIFLESLAAKPSSNEWPACGRWGTSCRQWEQWCSSQTWRVNILPHLKYLGIRCPKAFSRSECLDNLPLLRLVGWTRARLTPPLKHLKVWGEKGTIKDSVVDYTSVIYLWEHFAGLYGDLHFGDLHFGNLHFENLHFGDLDQGYDGMIVKGMVTRCLIVHNAGVSLLQLHSTVLFRWLQHLDLTSDPNHEIPFLPWLERIKRLEITHGKIPEYSLNLDLPLTQTLQCLKLDASTTSWMLGRSFKALSEFQIKSLSFVPEDKPGHKGLQIGLPACMELEVEHCRFDYLRFLSCSNVQSFCLSHFLARITFDLKALNTLHDFLFNLPCLQNLYIAIYVDSGLDSLIQVVFCDARERGVWRDIRSVEMKVWYGGFSEGSRLFDWTVGHQHLYEKWWKEFTVTKDDCGVVIVRASV